MACKDLEMREDMVDPGTHMKFRPISPVKGGVGHDMAKEGQGPGLARS